MLWIKPEIQFIKLLIYEIIVTKSSTVLRKFDNTVYIGIQSTDYIVYVSESNLNYGVIVMKQYL